MIRVVCMRDQYGIRRYSDCIKGFEIKQLVVMIIRSTSSTSTSSTSSSACIDNINISGKPGIEYGYNNANTPAVLASSMLPPEHKAHTSYRSNSDRSGRMRRMMLVIPNDGITHKNDHYHHYHHDDDDKIDYYHHVLHETPYIGSTRKYQHTTTTTTTTIPSQSIIKKEEKKVEGDRITKPY